MSEAEQGSQILFPLRTNVEFFRSPEDCLLIEERLKVAALLYERTLLHGGLYQLRVGEQGSFDFLNPRDRISPEEAREKREQMQAALRDNACTEFQLIIAGHTFVSGPTQHTYFSEFMSFADSMAAAGADWMQWVDGEVGTSSQAGKWVAQEDAQDEAALGELPFADRVLADRRIHNLNHDLAMAAMHRATLSLDPSYYELAQDKSARLGLSPDLRSAAVQIGLPGVAEVPWDEIRDLRREPGMVDFRRVVAEIDGELGERLGAATDLDLDREIVRAWNRRLGQALAATQKEFRGVATDALKGLLLDFTGVPLLGTAVSAVHGAADAWQTRRSWCAVFMRLAQ